MFWIKVVVSIVIGCTVGVIGDIFFRVLIKVSPRLVPERIRVEYGCFCHYQEPYGWVVMGSCPFHD